MNHPFGIAVKNLFATFHDENAIENNNILETTHHSQPIFEKIDPIKYFRSQVITIYQLFFFF